MPGEDHGGPPVSAGRPAVAWEVVGRDGGPPVLLMPPLGRDRAAWSAQIDALAADFRCLLFDPRGTGLSRDVTGDHSMATMAADATAVLDAVGVERAHVLGWSLGAAAAMALATQRPERVASLTLITPWARTDPHVRAGLAIMRDLAAGAEPAAAEMATLWLILSRAAVNAAGGPLDLDARAAVDAPGYPRAEVLTAYCESGMEHDLLDELRSLDVPTLVVGGDEDRLVDVAHAHETAAAIVGATLRVMKGEGASTPSRSSGPRSSTPSYGSSSARSPDRSARRGLPRRRSGSDVRADVADPEGVDLAVERGPGHAQVGCRLFPVAARIDEGTDDRVTLEGLERPEGAPTPREAPRRQVLPAQFTDRTVSQRRA